MLIRRCLRPTTLTVFSHWSPTDSGLLNSTQMFYLTAIL
uniref:Uncharacterized protein n=1 Tax=Anguilla anguilla TaxID=7936 RepID=A0A0E9UJJ1_ANGAN